LADVVVAAAVVVSLPGFEENSNKKVLFDGTRTSE